MKLIQETISEVCKSLFQTDVKVELTRPEEQFGDYATNVALQLAGKLGQKPRDIAEKLAAELKQRLKDTVSEVSVAGPGFINLRLSDKTLRHAMGQRSAQLLKNQEILVEYGDPNPFKEMHIGHLYTAIVGDAICNLLEVSGAAVRRVSYHGDVGMHVAKAIWALLKELKAHGKEGMADFATIFKASLGVYYAQGAKAFEEDAQAAEEIKAINVHIYQKDDETIERLHQWGTERSFGYFDQIFNELGIHYEEKGRYLESAATELGTQYVKDSIGKVFEESDGAIIFRGEKVGLHTRVFINSRGLPTYEAKDLGLAELKHRDYPSATKSIIITAHEQAEYFKVMLAALREIDAALANKTMHLSHGFLTLTTGKMSSRTGDVYSAVSLMTDVKQAAKNAYPESDIQDQVYKAALKYAFLKNRIGGDIVFDIQESIGLEGNSGPYIQYAHARARSILAKAKSLLPGAPDSQFESDERSLARKISEYPEIVQQAVNDLMPHHIAIYLYELAQIFNRFYERSRVIGDPRETVRLGLVTAYADTLKDGLTLLGIAAPDKM
jgi:arginyl-tRNA synthetase